MKKSKIYKTQDEFIADWLEYLYLLRGGKERSRRKGGKETISLEDIADNICSRSKQTLKKQNIEQMPFLQLIAETELSLLEVKIIIYLYMDYIEMGYQRGETILSILDNLTQDPKQAFLARKQLLDNSKLFAEEILVSNKDKSKLFRNRNDFYLSPKIIAMIEEREINTESENKEESLELFEVIKPRKSLRDVVLPEKTRREISGILKQIENREVFMQEWGFADKFEKGKGMILLFYGAPGTGKTLTAEAIAHELTYKLYTVSLADVLNPYYGVTEKNIKKVFDQAAQKDCVLLLDEVDAFIAKRSKGSTYGDNAHNRKVSLFLGLVENFEGIAIMTTNLPDILDRALQRRISLKLEFPKPDRQMREELWHKLIPAKIPLAADVNLKEISAKYEITGAEIKNVIMNAARKSLLKQKPIVNRQDLIESLETEHINDSKVGFSL